MHTRSTLRTVTSEVTMEICDTSIVNQAYEVINLAQVPGTSTGLGFRVYYNASAGAGAFFFSVSRIFYFIFKPFGLKTLHYP